MLNFTHHKDQFNILDPSSFHRLTKPTTKCNVNPIHPPLTNINASITNHSPSTTQPNKPPTPTINPNSPKLSLKKHHTNAKNTLTNQLNDQQSTPPSTITRPQKQQSTFNIPKISLITRNKTNVHPTNKSRTTKTKLE